METVDVVTQVDSFTILFELNQASLDLDIIRGKADYAPIPDQLAAELIDRLEKYKRTQEKENYVDLSFENNFNCGWSRASKIVPHIPFNLT